MRGQKHVPTAAKEILSPEQLVDIPPQLSPIKRHEFSGGDHSGTIVFFAGVEDMPFWRPEKGPIEFLEGDGTLEDAFESGRIYRAYTTNGDEFMRYYKAAWSTRQARVMHNVRP